MTPNGYYAHATRVGTFYIVPRNGRWHAMFEDEDLGSYHSPQHALDDLAGGTTYWPSVGNPEKFNLPDELGDWTFTPLRSR